ncbi:MAG: phosphoglucosamine mutase [Acidobacteria bacterium]|nr:phosphoglucosamine mutase [Acidobacteriota bacterium]
MGKTLFGTDGIRGVAGEAPLDPATVFAVGVCIGQSLIRKASNQPVLIGEDPRESSRWIADTIAAGLRKAGVEVVAAGVITTPGLAYLTASGGFSAGVMISASHNPYRDNGIKVFASTGFKLPDDDELEIEESIIAWRGSGAENLPRIPSLMLNRDLAGRYVDFLRRIAGSEWVLPGLRLVVDCANGAAAGLVRDVFADRGMQLHVVADQPNGRNINLDCGSLHLGKLSQAVRELNADMGVAFDGDADRALFVTGGGRMVDGDGVLLAASRYLRRQGALRNSMIVGTVMSNLGLELALAREGLKLLRAPVGDKYVLEEMLRCGANLGGEQSGHILFLDLATTGDGLLTALQVLRILAEEGQPLEQLVGGMEIFPQVIRNVRVREKVPLESLPRVMEQIQESQQRLGEAGRVLVRYSGTEPLARVMVEANDAGEVERHASAIARVIEETIGAR